MKESSEFNKEMNKCNSYDKYVGMDVHKNSISVAVAAAGRGAFLRQDRQPARSHSSLDFRTRPVWSEAALLLRSRPLWLRHLPADS